MSVPNKIALLMTALRDVTLMILSKLRVACLVTVLFLTTFSSLAADADQQHGNPPAPDQEISGTIATFLSQDLAQIDFLYYPTNIETRIRVSPSQLQTNFLYRLSIRDITGSERAGQLQRVLRKLRVFPSSGAPDVRWGLIFYSGDRRKLGSIFLSGYGSEGYVNGRTVRFNPALLDWLNAKTLPIFQ